jgi:hypothetical protein
MDNDKPLDSPTILQLPLETFEPLIQLDQLVLGGTEEDCFGSVA